MSLVPGSTLGPFRIQSLIGKGGMGEVFAAIDTRLDRKVALKILPPDFATDTDRLRRFQSEAKVLASLNHPNVLVIYEVGTDGAPYLVSELLEGHTLREELTASPLPPRKALEYAVQMANGLAAAHAGGIVHRDLKPENIFITKDARVKILDFGLAKPAKLGSEIPTPRSSDAPTVLQSTVPGLVLGTPAYMSPEQVRGEPADHRSDIFAFGCVLYEMLSGSRAFQRETAVESMSAILHHEPPELAASHPNIPLAVERVIRRCLEKSPERRFQSASDLAFGIENSAHSTGANLRLQEPRPARLGWMRLLPWAVAAALAVAFLIHWRASSDPNVQSAAPPAPVYKFLVPLPAPEMMDPGHREALAFSPDGTKLAYASAEGLWLVRLDDSGAPSQLVAGRGIFTPFWAPESSEIGYFQDDKLYRIGINSSHPVLICKTGKESPSGEGAAWLPNGRIILTNGSTNLFEVNVTDGAISLTHDLQEGELDFHDPSALPSGRGIVFIIHRNLPAGGIDTIAMVTPEGRRRVLLQLPGSHLHAPVYSSGHVLFGRSDPGFQGLWALPFSPDRLERTGEPFRLLERRAEPTVSTTGALAFFASEEAFFAPRQLVWVDRSGTILRPLGKPMPRIGDQRISPDGRKVLAVAGESGPRIWMFDVASGSAMPWSSAEGELAAAWSADGQKVIFNRRNDRTYSRSADGLGKEQLVLPSLSRPLGQSAKYRLLRVSDGDAFVRVDGTETNLTHFPNQFRGGYFSVSPDDTMLAMFYPDDPEREELYVLDFPSLKNHRVVSRGGGQRPVWHPNSQELFFTARNGRVLMSARLKPGTREFEEPLKLFDIPPPILQAVSFTPFAVSPDGTFLMLRAAPDEPTGSGKVSAQITLNWIEQFRRKK